MKGWGLGAEKQPSEWWGNTKPKRYFKVGNNRKIRDDSKFCHVKGQIVVTQNWGFGVGERLVHPLWLIRTPGLRVGHPGEVPKAGENQAAKRWQSKTGWAVDYESPGKCRQLLLRKTQEEEKEVTKRGKEVALSAGHYQSHFTYIK